MFVLTLISHSLDYCSFIKSLKLGSVSPPTLLFYFRIILAISYPLYLHTTSRIRLSNFTRNPAAGMLMEIVLNLMVFQSMNIVSLILFRFSLILLENVL